MFVKSDLTAKSDQDVYIDKLVPKAKAHINHVRDFASYSMYTYIF